MFRKYLIIAWVLCANGIRAPQFNDGYLTVDFDNKMERVNSVKINHPDADNTFSADQLVKWIQQNIPAGSFSPIIGAVFEISPIKPFNQTMLGALGKVVDSLITELLKAKIAGDSKLAEEYSNVLKSIQGYVDSFTSKLHRSGTMTLTQDISAKISNWLSWSGMLELQDKVLTITIGSKQIVEGDLDKLSKNLTELYQKILEIEQKKEVRLLFDGTAREVQELLQNAVNAGTVKTITDFVSLPDNSTYETLKPLYTNGKIVFDLLFTSDHVYSVELSLKKELPTAQIIDKETIVNAFENDGHVGLNAPPEMVKTNLTNLTAFIKEYYGESSSETVLNKLRDQLPALLNTVKNTETQRVIQEFVKEQVPNSNP